MKTKVNFNNHNESKLSELAVLQPYRFFARLALDWAGIVGAIALFENFRNPIGFFVASLILGNCQHGIAILGHEAVHFRICKNRWLNDRIGGLLCFFPVGITVSSYRDFHFPHHRDPYGQHDPEIPIRRAMGANWVPPFNLSKGFRLWFLSYLGFSLKELFAFVSMLPSGTRREKVGVVLFWSIALFSAWKLQVLPVIGLWIFSLMTAYFSTLRIQGWYEHGLEGMTANRYSLPHPIFRVILPHNIWVHYEHHKYPAIPFYNLEKARLLDNDRKVFKISEMVESLDSKAA